LIFLSSTAATQRTLRAADLSGGVLQGYEITRLLLLSVRPGGSR
jgi:hypothetical protein